MRYLVFAFVSALIFLPLTAQAQGQAETTPKDRCEGGIRRAEEVVLRAARFDNRDLRMRVGFADPHLNTARTARGAQDWRACIEALGKFRQEVQG